MAPAGLAGASHGCVVAVPASGVHFPASRSMLPTHLPSAARASRLAPP